MFYVYKITNIINNKIYIGQTNNPKLRWSQHKSNAKRLRGNQIITKAINKYGINNFDFEVIAMSINQQDVNFVEEQIILQYESRNPNIGYNIAIGGNVLIHTPDICKKISIGLKRFYKNNTSINKGRVISSEWRSKLSKALIGKIGPNVNKKFNDEWKNNISLSLKGRKLSKEHRMLISKSRYNKVAINRKLTFEVANDIRKEYAVGVTQKQLSIKYNLSQSCIFNILKYKTYKK